VDDKSPTVVYDFQKGVTHSIATALKKVGKAAGVTVEVRGMILQDAKLVVPPGRDENEDQ